MISSNSALMQHISKDDAAYLLDLVHSCTECTSKEGLDEVAEGLKQLIPFEFFVSIYSAIDGGGMGEPYHVITANYPDEWVKLYVERKYHLVDSVLKENFSRFSIQYWADTYETNSTDNEFVSSAEDFGLCSGYTSGVRNLAGNRGGLFSFAGRKLEKSERSRAIIETVTPHLYQAVERIVQTDRLKKAPVLSEREKEVLKWVTYGKTTWETSVILGIGERTVKFHLKNIMKKLNCVSRAHAAAIASELGIIEAERTQLI